MGILADSIDGIGPSSETKLNNAGIHTLDDLRSMNIQQANQQSGISVSRLQSWQNMALLMQIDGIDKQYAEGLVRSGITTLTTLANTAPDSILQRLGEMYNNNVIPSVPTRADVDLWQAQATALLQLFEQQPPSLATEVDVVWECMTCRGMRNYYEQDDHACKWFHQYGPYHAYDVADEESLKDPQGYLSAHYAGRRYQIPELLSGCRKAPIMSVGLNPNLRAANPKYKDRIYPYLDSIYQYAKHFRYRTNYKYSIEDTCYQQHFNASADDAVFQMGESVDLQKKYVSMYNEYNTILNAFQQRIGIAGSNLELGEDVSYYNFVACHSPRWNMESDEEDGIVQECFHDRAYFRRQLKQSMPKVIILFGKAIMKAIVGFFGNDFDQTNIPDPNQLFSTILQNNNYIMTIDGNRIRVIFSPHPTGARSYYVNSGALDRIVEAMEEEYNAGNLQYDNAAKHLKRSKGSCQYCSNDLFIIGRCPYGKII
jgi:predicted flap endonuclease-1-like 5' DNA nuclease